MNLNYVQLYTRHLPKSGSSTWMGINFWMGGEWTNWWLQKTQISTKANTPLECFSGAVSFSSILNSRPFVAPAFGEISFYQTGSLGGSHLSLAWLCSTGLAHGFEFSQLSGQLELASLWCLSLNAWGSWGSLHVVSFSSKLAQVCSHGGQLARE